MSNVFTSSPSKLPLADSTLNYQFNPSQKLSNLTIFETSAASAKCSDTNKRALPFHHAVNHGKDNSMKKSRKRLNRSVSQSVKPDNVHANFPYQKIFSQSPTSLIQKALKLVKHTSSYHEHLKRAPKSHRGAKLKSSYMEPTSDASSITMQKLRRIHHECTSLNNWLAVGSSEALVLQALC